MVKKFKNVDKKKSFRNNRNNKSDIPDEDFDNIGDTSNNPEFYLDDGDLYEEEIKNEELDGSDLDFGEDDYIESEDEEASVKEKKHILTKEELNKIFKKCNSGTTMAIVKIISIFSKLANHKVDSLDEDNILNKPIIIKKILNFSIKNVPEILLLKYNSIDYDKTNDKNSNLKSIIHRYLSVLAKYLKNAEKGTTLFLFKYIENISNLIILFKNLVEIYLKIIIKFWASTSSIKKKAITVIKFILHKKPEYFDTSLKLFYINYLEVAKAHNLSSIKKIKDLQNDIISILSLDYQRAYMTIFTFIRKLCLQLRTTLNNKKASSIKNIYNWQFINSISLWSRVVCEYYDKKNCEINYLAYPLIQTIIGVIRLNLVDIFYPLRLYLIKILNRISKVSGIYIPVASYIFEILESNHFSKYYKEKISENSVDYNINLKIKKEDFKNYNLIYNLLEESLDCLNEFLVINSNKFSFPELSYMIEYNLRKIQKNIIEKSFKEMIKKLIEKVVLNSEIVTKERCSISVSQSERIKDFENEMKTNTMYKEIELIQKKREADLESKINQQDNYDKFIEI